MIDRYTLIASTEQLRSAFDFLENMSSFDNQYNAAPSKKMPVTTLEKPNQVQWLQWGFMSSFSNNKKMSPKLFNADIVQSVSKPSTKKSLSKNRCAIYATGFFLWKLVSKKTLTPYYVHLRSGQPFVIGGFWEEKDEFVEKSEDSFMMLTRSASNDLKEYQEDMPFIVPKNKVIEWLHPEFEIDQSLDWLDLDYNEPFSIYPVSPAINQVELNDERLIRRTLPADQHGNYTLFG